MDCQVKNIAVIGTGNMGQQIAMCAAISGFNVTATDSNQAVVERMLSFKSDYLKGRVAKGRLTQEQADAAADRLTVLNNLEEAVGEADLVIEAVIEVLDVKKDLFKKMDGICRPHTILATNSSFIVSSKLACVTNRPEKVCNMHFFNPALVMKLVEIVRGGHTSQETVDTVYAVSEKLGKIPVVLNREIEGFIVNRLLEQYLFEAHRLADMGIASPEDIDKAVKHGLGHPMGPFELNDLTGLDLTYTIMTERYRKLGNPADRPSLLLSEHYYKGEYGRKTGKGFYQYDESGNKL